MEPVYICMINTGSDKSNNMSEDINVLTCSYKAPIIPGKCKMKNQSSFRITDLYNWCGR